MRSIVGKLYIFIMAASVLAALAIFVCVLFGKDESTGMRSNVYANAVETEAEETAVGDSYPVTSSSSSDTAMVEIADTETPLSAGTTWALANVLLMGLTVIEFLILVSRFIFEKAENTKRSSFEDNYEALIPKRRKTMRLLSIPIAIVSVVEFLITEDTGSRMIAADMYTIVMVVLFAVQTAILIADGRESRARI